MSDAIRCPVRAHTQRIRLIPRSATGFEYLPKSLAVDVARFDDDRTVIDLRQGRHFKVLAKHSGLDTVAVAERVIQFIQAEKPDAVIVHGDGLGAGVVAQLRHRGCECHEFHGGQPAFDGNMYFNRRAEVWGQIRD